MYIGEIYNRNWNHIKLCSALLGRGFQKHYLPVSPVCWKWDKPFGRAAFLGGAVSIFLWVSPLHRKTSNLTGVFFIPLDPKTMKNEGFEPPIYIYIYFFFFNGLYSKNEGCGFPWYMFQMGGSTTASCFLFSHHLEGIELMVILHPTFFVMFFWGDMSEPRKPFVGGDVLFWNIPMIFF